MPKLRHEDHSAEAAPTMTGFRHSDTLLPDDDLTPRWPREPLTFAPMRHDAGHLGKFLRRALGLIPREKRRCSVAPPIEVRQGSSTCVLDNEFAGGFGYQPRVPENPPVFLRRPSAFRQMRQFLSSGCGALNRVRCLGIAVSCSGLRARGILTISGGAVGTSNRVRVPS